LQNQFSEDRLEEIKRTMRNILVISKNDKPTLAGLLFFCDEPQKFIPYAKIVCAFIDDTDIAIPPFDKKEFIGNIPQQLEKSMEFMRLYLREEHIPKGLESEIHFELPKEALREALVNAIAHRDYTVSAPIRIFIF
jgi:ATP-dependent DNA helicase RecG